MEIIGKRKIWSADEIAAMSGVPSAQLMDWATAGILPHVRMGTTVIGFQKTDTLNWIRKNIVVATKGMNLPEELLVIERPENRLPIPEELNGIVSLKQIPLYMKCSGIYFLCDKGRVVYVGKSVSVYSRVATHIAEGEKEFDSAFWIAIPPPQLDQTESGFIRLLRPKYNKGIPADMGPIPENVITFTSISPSEAMDEAEKVDEVMVK